ncbi:MAG: hypothetical protein QXZ07_05620, partial [Nitrososphaerales archaeon]
MAIFLGDEIEEKEEIKALMKSLAKFIEKLGDLELENVEIRAEELTFIIQPMVGFTAQIPQITQKVEKKIETLLKAEFSPPIETYPGTITEVKIGATRSEGGSRRKVIKIGGE